VSGGRGRFASGHLPPAAEIFARTATSNVIFSCHDWRISPKSVAVRSRAGELPEWRVSSAHVLKAKAGLVATVGTDASVTDLIH
jgi:hypothetical protein